MRVWNLISFIGLVLVALGVVLPFIVRGSWAALVFPVGITLCWIVNKLGPAVADAAQATDQTAAY